MNKKSKISIQLIYSIALVVLIPTLVVLNNYITLKESLKTIEEQSKQQALAVNQIVLSGMNAQFLNSPQNVQNRLTDIKKNTQNFEEISIIIPEGDQYVIISSTNPKKINTQIGDFSISLAQNQNRPVAHITTYQSIKTGSQTRVFDVISPIVEDNKPIGFVDTKISLAQIDTLTRNSLNKALIMVICTVLIILLMLVNYFRLFEIAILAKKLQEIDKMKDDFISVASHELKTPIAVIRGYLAGLDDGTAGSINEQAKKTVSIITGQAERLNELINDLLNVSRLEQGRVQFNFEKTDLGSLTLNVAQTFAEQLQSKSLYLRFLKPEKELIANIDQAKYKEVLVNIIGNAIKYTLSGGIEISFKSEKDNIKTIIKDTGIGMSPEERTKLFEKFYRIKNDKTQSVPGTGLGLWITKELVEKMKGQIFVDSIDGQGTQFVLILPQSH